MSCVSQRGHLSGKILVLAYLPYLGLKWGDVKKGKNIEPYPVGVGGILGLSILFQSYTLFDHILSQLIISVVYS